MLTQGQLSFGAADSGLLNIKLLLNLSITKSPVHIQFLKVSLLTKPSSHVYCWPLTTQAYKHYSHYSLSIFVTSLCSSTEYFQKGSFSHVYAD